MTKQKWHTSPSCALSIPAVFFLSWLVSIEAGLTPSRTITAALKVHMMKANEMLWGYLNVSSLNEVSFLACNYYCNLNPTQED